MTIINGAVETRYVPDTQEAVRSQKVPANRAPGYTIEGTLDHVGMFRIVRDDDRESGIIVNAARMCLLGPIAKGDLIFGESRCAVGESAVAASGATSAGAARQGVLRRPDGWVEQGS